MSSRNTVVRAMHDLGLAAWFGGNLMGAVGVNGAAAAAESPRERARLSSIGWAKWTPVQVAAVGVHAVGGLGLIISNRRRLHTQSEASTNTAIKLAITFAAAGTTAYSGMLGAKVLAHANEGAEGATEPNEGASPQMQAAQRQLKVLQWVTPVLTGILLVMGSQQGEQQRSAAGILDRIR